MNITLNKGSQNSIVKIDKDILLESYREISEYLMWKGKGDFIETIYSRETLQCTELSEEYNRLYPENMLFKNGTIQREMKLNHCLGVLLLADKDARIKKDLLSGLKKFYPKIYECIRKKSSEIQSYFRNIVKNKTVPKEIDGTLYMIVYMMKSFYGFEFEAPAVYSVLVVSFENARKNRRIYYHKQDGWPNFNNMDLINQILVKYKSVISCSDIRRYMDQYELNKDAKSSELSIEMQNALIDVYGVCAAMMDRQDLSFSLVLEEISLLKKERQQIGDFLECIRQRYKGREDHYEKIEPYLYLFAVVCTSFCKEYNNTKMFFNSDNSKVFREFKVKYQALETSNQHKQEKIEKLEQQIKEFMEKANFYQENLEQCRRQAMSERYDTITSLQNQLVQLEAEQEQWRADAYDYARLKEMAYCLENDYPEETKEADIHKIVRENKIFVVGGDESWHKQLKANYLELNIVSGTQKNMDVSALQNADHVFIYTGHMAHAVYDKLTAFLYKRKISYSYVARYNLACIEQCIAEKFDF